MELERLEKIKEWTMKIESFISVETDDTSIHLKSKLKEFSDTLDFSIKDELYKKYLKEREIKQTTIKEI